MGAGTDAAEHLVRSDEAQGHRTEPSPQVTLEKLPLPVLLLPLWLRQRLSFRCRSPSRRPPGAFGLSSSDSANGGPVGMVPGKTPPLPCVSTAPVAKTLPLPCVSTAFLGEDIAFALCFRCLRG